MTLHAPIPRPACVAVTLRLRDPSSDLLIRRVRLLRDCVALAQQRWTFTVEAACVLPAEVQLLCAFRDREFGVGGAIRLIRSSFLRHAGLDDRTLWDGEADVLEISAPVVSLRRTFTENAPVRAGLVKAAEDWPYSSIHRARSPGIAGDLGTEVA